ncbi:helix-turn-helix domain-containing protein [Arthrobacter sp. A5]|uniref:helix-turn-helix domain-containing protein n=1 Tax=Arthrobacter sp. A5 TaxID=576926 RepID=UPI003DA7EDDF
MQQNESIPGSAEEEFGAAVAMMRKLMKLSQRDFAEQLTTKGMPVDASAVSRIEKGTRSVRLIEALTIAEVLNTDLEWLVSGSKTPSQELQSIRRAANRNLQLLAEPLASAAWSIAETRAHLTKHPELLASLTDEDFGTPSSPSEYVDWIAHRISRWPVEDNEYVDLSSQEEVDQIVDVLAAFARRHVGLDRGLDNDNGEHQEEA